METSFTRRAPWLARAETLVFPLCRQVPFRIQQWLLENVLQQLLAEASAEGELAFFEGRTLEIRVTDMGVGWLIVGCHPRLLVLPPNDTADVTILGRARAFVLLASGREDPDTLFFRRELCLEGDTELGLGVKNLLDSIERDVLPLPIRRLLSGAGAMANGI
ncbi:MAG: SCP2 domain-containing protein [Porticoccus sp.]|nr:MAG: SCP2 domain-containing protein [Porticoccus sp.]